jgi:hypothetical protein
MDLHPYDIVPHDTTRHDNFIQATNTLNTCDQNILQKMKIDESKCEYKWSKCTTNFFNKLFK